MGNKSNGPERVSFVQANDYVPSLSRRVPFVPFPIRRSSCLGILIQGGHESVGANLRATARPSGREHRVSALCSPGFLSELSPLTQTPTYRPFQFPRSGGKVSDTIPSPRRHCFISEPDRASIGPRASSDFRSRPPPSDIRKLRMSLFSCSPLCFDLSIFCCFQRIFAKASKNDVLDC